MVEGSGQGGGIVEGWGVVERSGARRGNSRRGVIEELKTI